MAGKRKKQQAEYRKRLAKGTFDILQYSGPYRSRGELGDKMPSINESLWYTQEGDKDVFFLNSSTAFDATPTPHPPVQKSARAIQREKLTNELINVQRAINVAVQAVRDAPSPQIKAEIKRELERVQKAKQELLVQLEPVKTSTQKVEEMGAPLEERPPFGRVYLNKGKLPVLAEYDRKLDKVKLFFMGAREKDGELLNCPPEKRQCLLLVPAMRSMLSRYTDSTSPSRGELGYWAVSSWDWPKVLKELKAMQGVVVLGSPELDLSKKFKSLDSRAKSVDSKKILFPEEFPPKKGKYRDGTVADFQTEGIKFLMSRNHAILADDMGLGKTYQAIIAAHSSVPKTEQILILCPAAVVGNWLGDIKKFAPGAPAIGFDSKFVGANGEPSERPEKVRFLVCSYQGASSQEGKAAVSKLLLGREWGLVILDEAHRLKKPETLGHKFVEKLKTERMWFLTGTPIANYVIDYYGLLKLAHHPLGKRADEFIEKYVGGEIKAGKVSVTENLELRHKLGEDLAGYVLRRTKEEVLKNDLPAKYGGIAQAPKGFIKVELPSRFAKRLVELDEKGTPRERLRHTLAVAKAPATWEVAQRVIDAGDKVVLFSTYTDVLHSFAEFCDDAKVLFVIISGEISTLGKSAMVKMFQGEALKEEETKWVKKNMGQWYLNLVHHVPVDEWTKEDVAEAVRRFGKDESQWPHEIQVVLAQMVAASEGVTLTKADTLLFNDLDYMPSRHEQAEDRIYRLSKPGIPLPHNAVYIGYMLSNDPMGLDANTMVGLSAKREEIQAVYGATSKDAKSDFKRLRDDYARDLSSAQRFKYAAPAKKRNPSDTLGM